MTHSAPNDDYALWYERAVKVAAKAIHRTYRGPTEDIAKAVIADLGEAGFFDRTRIDGTGA